jgi:hypothetical protein
LWEGVEGDEGDEGGERGEGVSEGGLDDESYTRNLQ